MSFLVLISTVRLHSERSGFVTRFYNVYFKNCKRFEINTVNHPPAQNMDSIKLLLDVSLIKIYYQDLKLVKFFSVVRTNFVAPYLLLFLRSFHLAVKSFRLYSVE